MNDPSNWNIILAVVGSIGLILLPGFSDLFLKGASKVDSLRPLRFLFGGAVLCLLGAGYSEWQDKENSSIKAQEATKIADQRVKEAKEASDKRFEQLRLLMNLSSYSAKNIVFSTSVETLGNPFLSAIQLRDMKDTYAKDVQKLLKEHDKIQRFVVAGGTDYGEQLWKDVATHAKALKHISIINRSEPFPEEFRIGNFLKLESFEAGGGRTSHISEFLQSGSESVQRISLSFMPETAFRGSDGQGHDFTKLNYLRVSAAKLAEGKRKSPFESLANVLNQQISDGSKRAITEVVVRSATTTDIKVFKESVKELIDTQIIARDQFDDELKITFYVGETKEQFSLTLEELFPLG